MRQGLSGLLGIWMLGLGSALAQPVPDGAPDPARAAGEALALIEQERQALRADMRERQRACRDRVLVNHCIRDLETAERQVLEALRAREVRIEEGERVRQRDAAIQRSLQGQIDRAQRAPATPYDPQGPEAARRAQAQADREAQAQARLKRQQERQRELEERRRSLDEQARSRARPADAPASAPATP